MVALRWPWSRWGLLRRYHTLRAGKIHAWSSERVGRKKAGRGTPFPAFCLMLRMKLERTQEVQEILLLLRSQVFEILDDRVGFRAGTGMLLDGVEKIRGSAIVQ
jgi:hypothetical protein